MGDDGNASGLGPRDGRWTRRDWLWATALGVGGALVGPLLPRPAGAAGPAGRVRDVERSGIGWTFWLELENSLFPAPGSKYTDNTVAVFVPKHWRVPKSRRIDTVLHFHGHRNTIRKALDRYDLRAQVYDSRQNCILVLPQGPVNAEDSDGGKLDEPGGLMRFLTELRQTLQTREVAKALGRKALPKSARVGTLCVSAHSGGYRVTARCLKHGGYPVSEVYLFDALYGDGDFYADWLEETKGVKDWRSAHKLVNFYATDRPAKHSRDLMAELDKRGVPYLHEEKEGQLTRQQLTKGRAIFIRTPTGHRGVVFKHNALRDCLYASRLERYVASKWFDAKTRPRRVEPRE